MKNKKAILIIDQGTTSTRCMAISLAGQVISLQQQSFQQYYPVQDQVEHDAEEIWQTVVQTLQAAYNEASAQGYQLLSLGITNQRETVVAWQPDGQPLTRAIVWQDRRTADFCESLRAQGLTDLIAEKTGLPIDPYFSASKMRWLLDQPIIQACDALKIGTIDSYLIYRLTGQHTTDVTNASRTQLFNINTLSWDDELLKIFNIPTGILPLVKSNTDCFGTVNPQWLPQALPITGVAGDQHAALLGQACVNAGMAKSTYGTGCFMMINTGERKLVSRHQLISTLAWQIDKPVYAMEGAVYIAGSAIKWLKDLGLFSAVDIDDLMLQADADTEVVYVPTFTGMAAPYWRQVQGAIYGLTQATTAAELLMAGLDAVTLQTYDLLNAFKEDGLHPSLLRIDGGMTINAVFNQRLANLLELPTQTTMTHESTAMGAFYLAQIGLSRYRPDTDLIQTVADIETRYQLKTRYTPQIDMQRSIRLDRWQRAVQATLHYHR